MGKAANEPAALYATDVYGITNTDLRTLRNLAGGTTKQEIKAKPDTRSRPFRSQEVRFHVRGKQGPAVSLGRSSLASIMAKGPPSDAQSL